MATSDPYSGRGESVERPSTQQGNIGAEVKETTERAQQKASQMADQAQHRAMSMFAKQKDQAAGNLESVAQAMRQTGQQLRQQDQATMAAQYTDMAADQAERMADYLRNKDVNQLMSDVERFARRQPELFLSGAFALGLLAARFLKSSSPQGAPRPGYSPTTGWRPQYDPEAYRRAMQESVAEAPYETRPGPRYTSGGGLRTSEE